MQSKSDSMIEVSANIAVGFLISWAVMAWIVAPLFDIPAGGGASFLITCIFTVTSILRQYILRRLFNGRSVGAALVQFIHRR